MSTVTIPVDRETARAFEQASAEEQRKLRLLLSLRLRELTTTPLPPLQAILDEVGREAQETGLTPEILDTLLDVKKPARGPRHEHPDQRLPPSAVDPASGPRR